MPNKLAIIIPAYNEGSVLNATALAVRRVLKKLPVLSAIIIVNDGSLDNTKVVAEQVGDIILTHRQNAGLGASLGTGIEYAKRHGFTYLITYDADGQHDPQDILKAYTALKAGSDVVIGSRFLGVHEQMPRLRRYILYLSNLITYLFFGIWTTDSQSGFRGLGPRAISKLRLLSNRMEVSSEFFAEIKRLRLLYSEIGIHVRYTKYSMSKGQTNTAGFGVLLKLFYLLGR